ncbi:hypothetical protein ACMFMG_012015 [Clarireedia jacksonii]
MDITMVLNATEIESKYDQALNHIDIEGIAGGTKSTLPIREPLHSGQELPPYPNNALKHSRAQLNSALFIRNITPTCNNRHRRHDHSSSRVRYFYRSHTLKSTNYTLESTKSQNKKTYTEEEVDFIRYHREDLGFGWEQIFRLFKEIFPNHSCKSNQGVSARFYRANKFKLYTENGQEMRDTTGKIVYLDAKVRKRRTLEGKEEGLPYTLVQRYPQRGLKYSWVGEQHKREMMKLASEMDDDTRDLLVWSIWSVWWGRWPPP